MPDVGADRVELLGDMFAHFVRVSLCQEVVDGLQRHGITYTHYEALRYVIAKPGSTVGEISKGLMIGYPKATLLVGRLHELGLLSKRGVRSDKRIARIYSTPEGENLASRVAKLRTRKMEKVLKKMQSDARDSFGRSLEQFLLAADQSGELRESFKRVGLSPELLLDSDVDSFTP